MHENMIYYVRLDRDVAFLPWTEERGKKLQEIREKKGLTRDRLVELLSSLENASMSMIVKLEIRKGRAAARTIESRLLTEICRILEASPSDFDYSELCRPKNIPKSIDTESVN
jgi:transcriptional regulator with XRE-family HTH domain